MMEVLSVYLYYIHKRETIMDHDLAGNSDTAKTERLTLRSIGVNTDVGSPVKNVTPMKAHDPQHDTWGYCGDLRSVCRNRA